ncbi:hypothetical protein ACA910_020755 [Epithemia clementina (nom. ined.)]
MLSNIKTDEDAATTKLKTLCGPAVMLINPWEISNGELGNLEFSPPLDYATRHLIQLLQDLNRLGFYSSDGCIKLDRCKHLLRGLLNHHRTRDKMGNDSMEHCSYRAHAILQNMQVFWAKKSHVARHRNVARSFVAEWPSPDREVFNTVLNIFQKTSSCKELSYPRRAQSIVNQMNARYDEHGDLECKTEVLHWNSVLMCWCNCADWQRSVHAATETFQRMTTRDASSFVHMILTCSGNGVPAEHRQKASALGAQVAARLWKKHISRMSKKNILEDPFSGNEEQQDDSNIFVCVREKTNERRRAIVPELPSRFYSAFLQAVRVFPDSTVLRVSLFDECFQEACMQGKINAVILNEFIVHVKSEAVVKKHLGPYLKAIFGKSPSEAAELLMELIPSNWTSRSDDKAR